MRAIFSIFSLVITAITLIVRQRQSRRVRKNNVPEPITKSAFQPTVATPQPAALLSAVNSASEKVAVLHIAFIALCAYILVIVFSTTDMDLLIGKGVKLPVVDVEVPIVGFYSVAPYLVVLIHFNLLLQLQLLSSKLYTFDRIAREDQNAGELRHQMNIFPYNHYLIGRQGPIMRVSIALVVTISILLLPLATLLTMQARFLAYQNELVTWAQRVATWLDVAVIAILWPVIMDPHDSWGSYIHRIFQRTKRNLLHSLLGAGGIALTIWLLTVDWGVSDEAWAGLIIAIIICFLVIILWPLWRAYFNPSMQEDRISGSGPFIIVLGYGLLLPFLLTAAGEVVDRPETTLSTWLYRVRYLDIREKVLIGKLPSSVSVTDLRSLKTNESTIRSIEPIDLQNRSLRGANFAGALLTRADMRRATLDWAILFDAQLDGANLSGASLQQARMSGATLRGAKLSYARLQGADLDGALLQGASLESADLRAANLSGARLEGVSLVGAQLTAADLHQTNLQAADLRTADLQAANLRKANLQGVDLSTTKLGSSSLEGALLYAISSQPPGMEPVDVRGTQWKALEPNEEERLRFEQAHWLWLDSTLKTQFSRRISDAARPGQAPLQFFACVRNEQTQVTCKNAYPPSDYGELLMSELEKIACSSVNLANAIFRRVQLEGELSGFIGRLTESLKGSTAPCPGAALLKSGSRRARPYYLEAMGERESRRGVFTGN